MESTRVLGCCTGSFPNTLNTVSYVFSIGLSLLSVATA